MNRRKIFPDEEKLIEALKIKSQAGAEALYDMYSKTLFGVLIRMVDNKELAEGLLQQSFIKIWSSFGSYDVSKGRLFTWMAAITKNLAKDFLRSKQYHQNLTTEPVGPHSGHIEQHQEVVFNTDTIGIKAYVNRLNQSHKDILNLIYFKGYTHVEAAEELKIPLGTIKTKCRTAIGILRTQFKNLTQENIMAL